MSQTRCDQITTVVITARQIHRMLSAVRLCSLGHRMNDRIDGACDGCVEVALLPVKVTLLIVRTYQQIEVGYIWCSPGTRRR